MEYFVYRLKNAKTFGDFIHQAKTIDGAIAEAKAHKEVTEAEYGIFERKCVWSTMDKDTIS